MSALRTLLFPILLFGLLMCSREACAQSNPQSASMTPYGDMYRQPTRSKAPAQGGVNVSQTSMQETPQQPARRPRRQQVKSPDQKMPVARRNAKPKNVRCQR